MLQTLLALTKAKMLSEILVVPSAAELLNILDSVLLGSGFSGGVTPGKTPLCYNY